MRAEGLMRFVFGLYLAMIVLGLAVYFAVGLLGQ
jgi:hypothetical protein